MAQSKWIVFYQNPWDRVVFKTHELDDRATLPYNKFKEFLLGSFFVKNTTEVMELLDKFQTILIDENGDHQVIKPEANHKDVTFDELYEMNKKEDPDETNKAANPMLERAKGIIEHIWQTKKNPKKKKKSKR
jgi:hypothetical protein